MYKGYKIYKNNLGRWCVHNSQSPYGKESDHKVFGTQQQCKEYINQLVLTPPAPVPGQ